MIANIVSTNKLNLPEEFNLVNDYTKINTDLPTLIVGYELVKEIYPDFNILDNYLGNNIYWTFKKTEKRDKFEYDLNWFISKVYKDLTNELIYIFIDPIQHNKIVVRKLLKKIISLENIVTLFTEKMVYLQGENFIFGIDLKLCVYIGLNTNKIKDKIKKISSIILEEKDIFIEYKTRLKYLDNQIKFIPFLYLIKNGKNVINSIIHIS
jgi:hypothetical protein